MDFEENIKTSFQSLKKDIQNLKNSVEVISERMNGARSERKSISAIKLSIIIPAHNEEKRIGRTLESYSNYFEKLRKNSNLDYEILVVINNTQDQTELVVQKYSKNNERIKYLNLKPGGKGFAVIQGFKHALKDKNSLIGFVDADLATPPESFYMLIKFISGYDGIIANRYLSESKITPPLTFRRLVVAGMFNIIVRSLLFMPYKDTQCGAKLFTRKAAEYITKEVLMSDWAFDVEVLYLLNKKGFKIKEIPTTWEDVGGSKINLVKSSLQMLLAVLQLRVRYSPLRRLLKPFKPFISSLWKHLK